ncbi:MAG: hypothetical protein A2201_02455 [Alicyclobacillus sp. RIFOXYA1_FULL_53_8]|nr:MAG: hypothetical protein A2201_02455 [Alicyclobacillus sp. RIFOXYA1_FULL_53_8]
MKKAEKIRLDALLVNSGHFASREAAKRAIMAGLVSRHHEVVDKPGTFVRADEVFDVAQSTQRYVGRGGLKLERALEQFKVDVTDKIVLDVGASTGGFTDCALQFGAAHVFSVDVGYGQLAWTLRNDPRVTVMERTNFRFVDPLLLQPQPEVAVMDVSFISTKLLLPKLVEVLRPGGDIVSLVKPQFEAGKGLVGKGGIVRDPQVHMQVLLDLLDFVDAHNLSCHGLDYSPISGGDGNLEYLAWWKVETGERSGIDSWRAKASEVVVRAWQELRQQEVDVHLP